MYFLMSGKQNAHTKKTIRILWVHSKHPSQFELADFSCFPPVLLFITVILVYTLMSFFMCDGFHSMEIILKGQKPELKMKQQRF